MDFQIWHLPVPASCVGVGLNKGQLVLAGTLVPERASSSALVLKPVDTVLPHMSLTLFQLLALHWSLGQCVSE